MRIDESDSKRRRLFTVGHPEYGKRYNFVGDGKPDCPLCAGRGVVRVPNDTPQDASQPIVYAPPVYQDCTCTHVNTVVFNVEAAWPGLMRAANIDSSPLLKHMNSNIWVRARDADFRKHLRHVAIRRIAKAGRWYFRVVTDADLMSAWLANIAIHGAEIMDMDVHPVSAEDLTLMDMVLPPELLIVWLGVKRASNKEMPGVLHEALAMRYSEDKPTWIVDQPGYPLDGNHLCFSQDLLDDINAWGYHGIIELGKRQKTQRVIATGGFQDLSLGDILESTTSSVLMEDTTSTTPDETGFQKVQRPLAATSNKKKTNSWR